MSGQRWVLYDRFAEVVDDGCDGECATEPFIETRLRHRCLLGSSLKMSKSLPAVVTPISDRHHVWSYLDRDVDVASDARCREAASNEVVSACNGDP